MILKIKDGLVRWVWEVPQEGGKLDVPPGFEQIPGNSGREEIETAAGGLLER